MFNRKKPDTNEDSGAAVNSSASTPSSQSDATQRINQPVHNPCKRLGEMLVEEGVIAEKDLALLQFVDEPQAAWDAIRNCYGIPSPAC